MRVEAPGRVCRAPPRFRPRPGCPRAGLPRRSGAPARSTASRPAERSRLPDAAAGRRSTRRSLRSATSALAARGTRRRRMPSRLSAATACPFGRRHQRGRMRSGRAARWGDPPQPSYRQSPLRQLSARLLDPVNGDLPVEPVGQFRHAVGQGDLRTVAQDALGLADIGEAVPDIADAELAGQRRGDPRLAQLTGKHRYGRCDRERRLQCHLDLPELIGRRHEEQLRAVA